MDGFCCISLDRACRIVHDPGDSRESSGRRCPAWFESLRISDNSRGRAGHRQAEGAPKGETLADAKSCTYEFANGQDEFEIWISPGDAFARMRKDAKNPVTVGGFGEEAFMDRGDSSSARWNSR